MLPNETSAACWAAVDELARRYRADGDARTLDQARADAMADLVLGHATVSTTVMFLVPALTPGPALTSPALPCVLPGTTSPSSATTPLGLPVAGGTAGDLPVVQVPGVGEVPGEVVRQLAAAFGTRALVALCDARTGRLSTDPTTAYRPPAWLDRLVKARDGTCRFFGCTVPARRCDVDHVIAHPRGPTEEGNLMALCRHHHRLKQQERWQVTMTPHGVVTWTTPVGDRFTTWPVDHLGVTDLAS